MKRKISSFITAFFILMICVFASACGDKYEDMEFKVYYAYSADATQWYDGTDGITLNYNPNDEYVEGEEKTSLVFDNNGGKLFIKIEIENVKSKHLDSIIISPTSTQGITFSQSIAEQNEIVEIPINGNVNTVLKLFESNSGKKHEVSLKISRELESIDIDNSIRPAMTLNSTLNLFDLNNLIYNPINQTSQIGVNYSIDSVGKYDDEGNYTKDPNFTEEMINENISINNGKLTVGNFSLSANHYIARIKATSVFHDGTNGEDEIANYFDVYLVEKNISAPNVYFNVEGDFEEKTINLYENGGNNYSTSTITVNTSALEDESVYFDGINTINEKVSYSVQVYVKNKRGVWQKYDFEQQENEEEKNGIIGINGLGITKDGLDYTFSIVNEDENNKVKICYEIEGLDFYNNQTMASVEFEVQKAVLPTNITVNGVNLANGSTQSAQIYSTTNDNYTGYALKLAANPNYDPARKIKLEYDSGKLIVADKQGRSVGKEVLTGATVYVKFKAGVTSANLKVKTLKSPEIFDGKNITSEEYIEVTYNFEKVVTADSFDFVDSNYNVILENEAIIGASQTDKIYVKVNYSGGSLNPETIRLESDNNLFIFNKSGTNEMLLSEATFKSGVAGSYSIYEVEIEPTNAKATTDITVSVIESSISVANTLKLSSVYLMDSVALTGLDVIATTNSVTKIDKFNFAVASGEYAEFAVQDGYGKSNTINSIEFTSTEKPTVANTSFSFTKSSTENHTLKLNVNYYISIDNKIVLRSIELEIQVAIYDPIKQISAEVSNGSIGYINQYYTETSKTSIEFNSGNPTETLDGGSVKNVVGIQVGISNFESLKNSNVSIKFISEANEIYDLLGGSKNIILKDASDKNLLRGKIQIELKNAIDLKEISITLTALRFGSLSNISKNIIVKIVEVDKAEDIVVSTKNFVNDGLELSFMDVVAGGYDQDLFNVSLKFATLTVPAGKLRFEDMKTAMTYILYRYEKDANGDYIYVKEGNKDVIKKTRIEDNFFDISIEDGVVKIRAYKEKGGGSFRLVLATKDSYKPELPNPTGRTIEESNFSTTYAVNIYVQDGNVGSEYTIRTVDDLKNISYNLDKNFVLATNLGENEIVDISPIGLIGTTVHEFNGSLKGVLATVDGNGSGVETQYSIRMLVKNTVTSTEYGKLAGLFAILGDDAVVKDLNIMVEYDESEFISTTGKGLQVGTVTAINKGEIDNVIVVNSVVNEIQLSGSAGVVNFGAIVGLNANTIKSSRFEANNSLEITSSIANNIGLIAGINTGTIEGDYVGKDSLKNYIFDVLADLSVQNTTSAIYNIGGVAGINNGTVSRMLVGGKILMSTAPSGGAPTSTSSIGGIVGLSNETGNKVELVTALSLNIISTSNNINVGGIVGIANATTVNNVKFVSGNTTINGEDIFGELSGKALVGGIVANSTNGTIEYASVENFVKTTANPHYSIQNGTTTAGLVALISGTTVKNSFVSANISSSGTIYLTTNTTESNSYYIGSVNGTISENKTKYSIVNGKLNGSDIAIGDYIDSTITVDEKTTDWTNIYVKNASNTYTKVETYDSTKTYVKFKASDWKNFVYGLVGLTTPELIEANKTTWAVQEDYNFVNFNGVDLFFPYLLKAYTVTTESGTETKYEPLQIVEPKSISAEINQDYVTTIDSAYVNDFNFEDYEPLLKETVIVNYINGVASTVNSHYLFEVEKDGETYEGLLNLNILPENAQSGLAYEIIGDGYDYAYINSDKQIVFTGVSNQTPILVKIYSVFNLDIKTYVAFYTQNLFTDLTLSASDINPSSETDVDYQINAYTGQNNKIISIGAKNNGDSTIFDIYGIEQYLYVDATGGVKLKVDDSSYDNITLKIEDGQTITSGESEIITFTLKLKKEYFGTNHITNDIPIGTIKLKVYLYNSAKSIDVNGSDAEISSGDDVEINVALTTDFIDESKVGDEIEKVDDITGEIYNEISVDGIRVKFNILSGQNQVDKLLEVNNVDHFAELFDVQITSSLLTTKGVEPKTIGYNYKVILELIDEHDYRYITENIKYNIVVYAKSNRDDVNSEDSPIEIVMKPTSLSTARIENYYVTSLNVNTNYSTLVTNDKVQTSIIEPGSLGNVMMIYLEPSYSNVKSARIKTSSLYVPSLGKNVQMKFTQLVLDNRGGKTAFTTLYGENATTQQDDTLELKLISEIKSDGTRIYNGVICVYIQLEEFYGLEASMTVELDAETERGTVTRTKDLLTTYIPSVEMNYDEDRAVSNGYLIQQGTSNNEVKIKIIGYQFNSNPEISLTWNLPEGSDYKYVDDSTKQAIFIDTGKEGWDGETQYLIGDYVQPYLVQNYDQITYNQYDDSYTLILKLNVAKNLPASFKLNSSLSLTTKDGQLKSSDENPIIFYPTDYILNSIAVENLTENGRRNIPINKTREIELAFLTDNTVNVDNISDEIYEILLDYAKETEIDGEINVSKKIASLFSYYKNGNITLSSGNYTEFEFNLVNEEIISITGIEKFNNTIYVNLWYGYEIDENGVYSLKFGEQGNQFKPVQCSFVLNVFAVDQETEIPIYSADELYNPESGTWLLEEGGNYVLMNDITLEQVVPITTAIRSFDGNNRVISIKSFKVNDETRDYGLFASIGTYTIQDQETEQDVSYQTILKNVIVDYGSFEGSLALNNNKNTNITFGGLVAKNNGGIIYNCDVINLDAYNLATVDIIVSGTSNVTFGGLVGENSGVITNSRVGRNNYTKITATPTTESAYTIQTGGLSFSIFNKEDDNSEMNQFAVVAGGFVGTNSGIISTSYVASTNLYNYSTHETTNKTAGFVGTNSGTISYSYSKADDKTITAINPYSTGYVIENKGNGIVSGFVYDNLGTIDNSYSNLELRTKSAYISGFVYNNTGKISESYAATTMNAGTVNTYAEQPFIGVNPAGDLLSNGTLENTYYLMRTSSDDPYTDDDKDVAQGLNEENFQNGEYLVGFVFVLTNSRAEREQGIWSYYTLDGNKRILPELMNANVIAHSYRYVENTEAVDVVFKNTVSYAEGTAKNPHIISNVKEFNEVFTYGETNNNFIGYVRLINNIDFNDDETAIQTRSNYKLGTASSNTSIEGNGMSISGIYLDVGEDKVETIGLFSEIENAYVKNLNLNFATPTTDGQFSTTTATYSGGLAGKVVDSAIINIKLNGANTTLTGSNFVGGVAGMVSGTSLIYGIETNINVKAGGTENYLYYNEKDFNALNIGLTSGYSYENYLKHLSYAGGVAGVIDLKARPRVEYNVQFVDVRGDQMKAKTIAEQKEANIIAEYAGGVAGYASDETSCLKLRYFTGLEESIRGDTAVGGLFGVALGIIKASQVAAEEEVQFTYDTAFGDYVIDLTKIKENATNETAELDTTKTGNMNLLEGNKYVGGLVGISLDTNINACYSKVGIKTGEVIGGITGIAFASTINYSYAIPYVNIHSSNTRVGGLIGSAYSIKTVSPERNKPFGNYEALVRLKNTTNAITDIQFTYSTLIVDDELLKNDERIGVYDYVCADFSDVSGVYIGSNKTTTLMYVFAGTVDYSVEKVENLTNSIDSELSTMFSTSDPAQTIEFQEVFSGWSIIKYWSLKEEKYFPLLNNKTVDNYIEIDSEDDLALIRNNLKGKFKVIQDITVSSISRNWVIPGTFEGVLIGEIENSSTHPTITIQGLKPNEEDTSGFFQRTHNATINNLTFDWYDGGNGAINPSVTNLGIVSGLICEDLGDTLISNVTVKASEGGNYLIKDKTIAGFGGLVGTSTNTNILGSTFNGKLKATLSSSDGNVYVGGIVANAQTLNPELQTGVFNNCAVVGVKSSEVVKCDGKECVTADLFELTINTGTTAYIGGSIGKATNVAIASNPITGNENSIASIKLNLNGVNETLYVGGVVGYGSDGLISSCEASTNIVVAGSTTDAPKLNVGGLAGGYTMTSTSSTSGISQSNTLSRISTYASSSSFLNASDNTHVRLSTGVAELSSNATMKQCLFTGEINTEDSKIPILYAGGSVAITGSSEVDLEEVATNSVQYVGTDSTTQLYVGGLIGAVGNGGAQISYSVAYGRIIPITSEATSTQVYAGGLIGKVENTVTVNNSFTTSSIVADSIADSAIANLNIGALVGKIPNIKTSDDINFTNVFYSSDLALTPDENYLKDDSYLGTNLSAQTMLLKDIWHKDLKIESDKDSGLWKTFITSNADIGLPYLTSLQTALRKYGILTIQTGETELSYVTGSVMAPKRINEDNELIDPNKYTYYLLMEKDTSHKLPTGLTGSLNGILLGQDIQFVLENPGSAIISKVKEHSAISNINVLVSGTVTISVSSGIIANENNGVVFNCSVQGNGIAVLGSGAFGLIVGTNTGMVSYCFSTAEIVSSEAGVGGIVHTNEGKMLSNYFTGYIESSQNSAGLINTVSGGYVYNNYMGGVINAGGNNAFFVSGNLTGSNNFIDKYSDIGYNGITNVLTVLETAELMANSKDENDQLAGKWHTTVSDGSFKSDSHFGYNYNYPVYRFNKNRDIGNSLTADDITYQTYTGTGEVKTETVNGVSTTPNLEQRYSLLVNGTQIKGADTTELSDDEYEQSQNHYHAFKISHLGILSAVRNLLNEDIESNRNYVVIYDIDAEEIVWKAIGGGVDFAGFKHAEDAKFSGVFITNKYFAYDPSATSCEIANFKNQGLFANVDNAYIANVKLGSFTELKDSGALGLNVVGTVKNFINFIEFKESAKISMASDSEYFGGLFGILGLNGTATTTNVSNIKIGANTKIIGDSAYMGTLFGKVYCEDLNINTIIGENVTFESGNDEAAMGLVSGYLSGDVTLSNFADFSVAFNSVGYAGGLIGEFAGGTIEGNGTTITISDANQKYIKMLGGVVGKGYGNIQNVNIALKGGDGSQVNFRTNGFGGVIGEVTGTTKINTCQITSSNEQLVLTGNAEEEKYYGLIAGLQTGELDAQTFANFDGDDDETEFTKIANIKVDCAIGGESSYDEASEKFGVGIFVGANKGNALTITVSEALKDLTLEVVGVPSVGGVVGYVAENSTLTADEILKDTTIKGTTNVGGVYGYLKGEIKATPEGAVSGLTIQVAGPTSADTSVVHQNFGGLFGRWENATNGAITITGEPPVSTNSFVELTNKNTISILNESSETFAYNIGGIAGKVVGLSSVGNLTNEKEIKFADDVMDGTKSIVVNRVEDKLVYATKVMNVGGIFGNVEKVETDPSEPAVVEEGTIETLKIVQVINKDNVSGYQNVGGLIGYVSKDMNLKILNNESITLTGNLGHDGTSLTNGSAIPDSETEGNIIGVVNVGGAIGYAGAGTTISQIYSKANVYGNANVGGLVGLNDGAVLNNNYILGDAGATSGIVKGVYYKAIKSSNSKDFNAFIPTSVGGLVGITHSDAYNSNLSNNVIESVMITSAEEGMINGKEIAVIKTTNNHMANLSSISEFTDSTKFYNLDKKGTIAFDSVSSGYGGLAGKLSSRDVFKAGTGSNLDEVSDINTNALVNLTIKAQLGVNVGTAYGAFDANALVAVETENHTLTTPSVYGNVNVDGAYNVGGIVGFINGVGGQKLENISNSTLKANSSTTVTLQPNFVGINVGGLIGKTNSGTISKLVLDNSPTTTADIKITAANCFNAGGLIGLAYAEAGCDISGNLGKWTQQADGSFKYDGGDNVLVETDDSYKALNFGGLIGMLKGGVNSNGLTFKVSGNHMMPFTISTIENANYVEGESRLGGTEQNSEVKLTAEAMYVNKDSFKIDGSRDASLYSTTATNPLNPLAKGWHKEYTGFRVLQRRIPAEENNNAGWDSIMTMFDASQITHVGTIANLGLDKTKLAWPSETKVELIKDDHICFTIYEQADGVPTLYSAIGIASLSTDANRNPMKPANKYGNTEDPKWYETIGEWFLGVIKEENPTQISYIDLNSSTESVKVTWGSTTDANGMTWPLPTFKTEVVGSGYQGLTYFHWDAGYRTIDGGQAIYQNEANHQKYVTYQVDNYLNIDGDPDKDGRQGAYFKFDVIFENKSLDGKEYSIENQSWLGGLFQFTKEEGSVDATDDYLPTSGSIFAVTGMLTPPAAAWKNNKNAIDNFSILSKWGKLAADAAITFLTFGIGKVATTAGKAASKLGAGIFNVAEKIQKLGKAKGLLNRIGYFAIDAGASKAAAMMLWAGVVSAVTSLLNTVAAACISYDTYIQPSNMNYGYLSTSYTRTIEFETIDGKTVLKQESDTAYETEGGHIYTLYSNTRPKDYFINEYVGMKLSLATKPEENSNVTTTYNITGETRYVKQINSYDLQHLVNINKLTIEYGKDTTDTTDDKTDVFENCLIGYSSKDGYYYQLIPKYEYKNGLYFKYAMAETYEEQRVTLGLNTTNMTEAQHTYANSEYYIYGSFDEIYSYASQECNLLTGSTGSYSVNGVTIDETKITVEYKDKTLYYNIDNSYDKTGELGYDYFEKVYFTANGYIGAGLTKYAKFKETSEPIGTQGIDYIIVDGARYQLVDEAFSSTQGANGSDLDGTGHPDYIYHPVYPGAFENPYFKDNPSYSTLKDSTTTYDSSNTWSVSETGVAHNPTYYLYEGGYILEELEVSGVSEIFVFIEISTDETIKYYDSSTEGNEKYGEIKGSDYDQATHGLYKDYNGNCLKDSFIKEGDKLYVRSDLFYTDSKTGLLTTIQKQKDDSISNFHEGMYLTYNQSYQLFTRYKYGTDYNNKNIWESNIFEVYALDENGNYIMEGDEENPTPKKAKYSLIPTSGNVPNSGYTTELIESARVVLTGGDIKYRNDGSITKAGSITIN